MGVIMNTQLSELKRVAIFLAGIFAASIPAMAHAGWSITGLGTLGGDYSTAWAINDSGQVVGESLNADGDFLAFITGPDGVGMTGLIALGGKPSNAYDINDSGQVVGEFWANPNTNPQSFITGANGTGLTIIPDDLHMVKSINNSGQVVGNDIGFNRPFITDANDAGMTYLGTLGGDYSVAQDVNDSGQVVGVSTNTNSISDYGHAFITGANGVGMTDLGTLDGDNSSYASAINDSGQVVGNSVVGGNYNAEFNAHAFLFSNGEMIDLSLLAPVVAAGWTFLHAVDINDNGQIVGEGVLHGLTQAFLLSPIPAVPEPETYLMLLAGLGLLGLMAQRRKETVV